jgi:hypothetical protein
LRDKLINKLIKRYRHILRKNEERIQNKVLKTKIILKCPKGKPRSRQEQVRKYITQN